MDSLLATDCPKTPGERRPGDFRQLVASRPAGAEPWALTTRRGGGYQDPRFYPYHHVRRPTLVLHHHLVATVDTESPNRLLVPQP